MKRIVLFILTIICLFSVKINVFAVCEDDELNDWAETIEIFFQEDYTYSYDSVDENGNEIIKEHIAEYYYKLFVCAPRSDIDVKVTDSENTKEYSAIKCDFDNSYIVGSDIHFSKKTYNFKIYGNSSSNCPGELLRTLKYTVPAYNKYVGTEFCILNPDVELCQADKDTSNMTEEEVEDYMADITEKNKINSMATSEKILYYIGKYWYYVVIPIIIVSVVYLVRIKLYKKKVEKE